MGVDEQNPPRGAITQATAGHRGDKALAGLSIVGMAPAEEKVSLPGEPIMRREHAGASGSMGRFA